jgi:hypothetical protein
LPATSIFLIIIFLLNARRASIPTPYICRKSKTDEDDAIPGSKNK